MSDERIVRNLEILFEDERKALVSGEVHRLARLAQRKEHLIGVLQSVRLPAPTLKRFAGLTARNQALIEAAQSGLKSAVDRLREIQRGASVGTYSRTGVKSEISKPVRTLQRRA